MLKVKNVRLYLEEYPDFEYINTENAKSNVGMLSINEGLGFEPYATYLEYQGNLD